MKSNLTPSRLYELRQLKPIGDQRGKMIVLEGLTDIPFEIRRLFYIYENGGDVSRGHHANRQSKFAFVCVSGSCKIKLVLAHNETVTVQLNAHEQILCIDKMVWKEMYEFSSDCILLVASDCCYQADEYIRSIEEYFKVLGETQKCTN